MYISVKTLKTLKNYAVMLRLVSDIFPMLILYSWQTFRLLSLISSRPNTIINIINLCCVWMIHHCIFIYVLNTSGWQILNKRYWLFGIITTLQPSYPYFDAVLGLEWSNDPTSYTGGSIATGSVSLAGQFKGDDLDLKGYPSPPGWGLSVGLITYAIKPTKC